MEPGVRSVAGSRFATATEKRSTADHSGLSVQGALLLTAGYGTRAEPLSLVKPKCLLPYQRHTVLSLAAKRALQLSPEVLLVNATRRPDLVLDELESFGGWRMIHEPRPLGVVGTLSRIEAAEMGGTLLVSNTDMVCEPDMMAMLRSHRESGASWTALCGPFPARGSYSGLSVGDGGVLGAASGRRLHYYGISLMEPPVLGMARRLESGGFFSGLLSACGEAGLRARTFVTESSWLDMGSLKLLRGNILAGGSWISPGAAVSPQAELSGTVNVGEGCRIGPGARVRDSVLLAGSSIESGLLEEAILQWNSVYEREGAVDES